MKPLFTPGATLCPKAFPDILSCSNPIISRKITTSFTTANKKQVQIARNNILHPRLKRIVFGKIVNNVNNSTLTVGGIVEGQLGGILGRPRNF
jgi:hypothetical protein